MPKKLNKLCVLGQGISYSLSPLLHVSFARTLGEQDTGFAYDIVDVPPEKLESTVERLLREYQGFNVTKPYKEKVAAILGKSEPVNTVRCRDKASTSTDGAGFWQDYTRAFGAPRGNVLVLGAGGAAKAVLDSLENKEGVRVSVYNRTYEKAQALARGNIYAVTRPSGKYDAIVNCTSLGLHGEQSAPADLQIGHAKCYDLIYAPPKTPFLQCAKAGGAKIRNGLGMLIYQAIASQEFWREEDFDERTKKKLYKNALHALQKRRRS